MIIDNVILINNTNENKDIRDLSSLRISALSEKDISEDFDYYEICESGNLKSMINDEDLSLKLNGETRTIEDAIKYLTLTNLLDIKVSQDSNSVLHIPFTCEKHPYVNIKHDKWTPLAYFKFLGTNSGLPTKIQILAKIKDDEHSGSIELFDDTNDMSVATIININNKNLTEYSTETFFNLPTNEAWFQIRGKLSSKKGKSMYVYNFTLRYGG